MSDAIPQGQAIVAYMAMVAGAEPATSYFEIRSKRTTGAGMSQDWIALREVERAAASLVNRGKLSDTYLGAAPRSHRKGGIEAIERVWCVWTDCDSPESLARLASFRPLPSLVIRSGSDGHAHAYWPLRSPVPPKWAKRANQRLALRLGADRNATDAARIMRPPLTLNFKHDPPRSVQCTRLELDVFRLGQIIGHLPDERRYVVPARNQARARPADACNLLDGLTRTVREAAVGNRNAALYWAACRVAESDLDTDDAREILRDAALASGLCEPETDRTLASALETRAAA